MWLFWNNDGLGLEGLPQLRTELTVQEQTNKCVHIGHSCWVHIYTSWHLPKKEWHIHIIYLFFWLALVITDNGMTQENYILSPSLTHTFLPFCFSQFFFFKKHWSSPCCIFHGLVNTNVDIFRTQKDSISSKKSHSCMHKNIQVLLLRCVLYILSTFTRCFNSQEGGGCVCFLQSLSFSAHSQNIKTHHIPLDWWTTFDNHKGNYGYQ